MTELFTPEEIYRMQLVAQAASPGPWKYPHRDFPGQVYAPQGGGCLWRGEINHEVDARFIATFDPDTVLRLLELVGGIPDAEDATETKD